MLITVHPANPQKNILDKVAKDLQSGAVYVLPTDTVYAFVTTLGNKKSIEKLYQLKEMPPNKPLSLYCRDFSQASHYIRMEGNKTFRLMKSNLPGPFTLIFQASKNIPHYTLTKQESVGIRIINHPVIEGILERIEMPLIGTSVFVKDSYLTFPEALELKFGKLVAGIIDTGPLELSVSTILDMRSNPPEIIRKGKGEFKF